MGVLLAAATLAPAAAAQPKGDWGEYQRPAKFETTSESEVPIEMSDETVLRAKVVRPAAVGKFPVIVTQTPYNKATPLENT